MATRVETLGCGLLLTLAAGCEAPHLFPGMGRPANAASSTAAPVPASRPVVEPVEPPMVVRNPIPALPAELAVERGPKPDSSPDLTARGLALFSTNCVTCHGVRGAGNGPAAFILDPAPRDFTRGIFELHSNESGSLPTDEDLFDTITRGEPGSAMPPFERLPAAERWALVEAVKSLAVFKDEDEGTEIHFFRDRPPAPPLTLGNPIEGTPDVVARGKAGFQRLECWKCHGPEGKGNGPSATDLKTAWGGNSRPRDFELGQFNGALSVRDLVLRVRTGLGGTPMPAVAANQANDEELWRLAHYVASLRRGPPVPQPIKDGLIVSSRSTESIPADLLQPRFWMDLPFYEVPLAGDGPAKAAIAVQRDAAKLALLVTWEDPIERTAPAVPEDFLKGVTVELACSGQKAEWEWRSEWQRDAAKRPAGAFEEGVIGSSLLQGCGHWADGKWSVLLERPLAGDANRLALQGHTLDLVVTVADRRPGGPRTSKSGTLRLVVR
jgi:mono/diheme cytochrome c family protein